MTDIQNLSERLRDIANQIDKAADVIDQKDAEIALLKAEIAILKDGRQLHDELVDHLENVIAQAENRVKQK